MCDYSLYTIQNRLAEEGEELVLHRFETGTLGFASVADLSNCESAAGRETGGIWSRLKSYLFPHAERLPAICIPPGARLLLTDVPRKVQLCLGLGPAQVVSFTEISSRSYSYRDALLLPNGTRVLLQDLPEGLPALVLSMSPEPSIEPVHKEVRAA